MFQVFCRESIVCFRGTASKFFLKLLVTIPVAPIITGIIVHFRFHIRCISIHKLLYFLLLLVVVVVVVVKLTLRHLSRSSADILSQVRSEPIVMYAQR